MTGRPQPFRVITFNTAVGNPRIETDQRAFLDLPFYREIIDGGAGAPIVALQEVGREQAKALRRAERRGPFRVVHIARPRQGNALVVPERFTLLARRSRYFLGSQLGALARAVWRAVTTGARFNHRQYLELRMWSAVRLRDSRGGLPFTVFNTHLSGDPHLRVAQATALMRRVHRARRDGPVILAGDLNARPRDGEGSEAARADAAVWDLIDPLEDMAPAARDPRRPTIDWILADGFSSLGARQYTDDSLELPGLPCAEVISDHYAKEATIVQAGGGT